MHEWAVRIIEIFHLNLETYFLNQLTSDGNKSTQKFEQFWLFQIRLLVFLHEFFSLVLSSFRIKKKKKWL